MGALAVIFPALALEAWLLATTGRGLWRDWARKGAWPRLAGLGAVGVVLGYWLAFQVTYKWGTQMRVTGFPVPAEFSSLENGQWIPSQAATALRRLAVAADLLAGPTAALFPFKIAAFLREVKAELAR